MAGLGLGVAVGLWFRWVRKVCARLGYPFGEVRREGRGEGCQVQGRGKAVMWLEMRSCHSMGTVSTSSGG